MQTRSALRTLLIDNYDSYTYNLFHLIAEANGAEPVVIRNDARECADLDLAEFDSVVVSPGPGHPAEARDFGAVAELIERCPIPVLGVCLGHQGIGLGERARVAAAPEPRHGHLSTITHSGRGLFRGIPQSFRAVRYHSLCVTEPLPSSLEPTAWAEDGVLMGLRHRSRPLWGVQFHPESVLTEHGHRMLANFRDITTAHTAANRPQRLRAGKKTPAASAGKVVVSTPPEHRPLRLHTRRLDIAIDPEATFTRLYADAPRAFWLDSSRTDRAEPGRSERGSSRREALAPTSQGLPPPGPPRAGRESGGEARFSYFGDGRGPLAEFVRYDVADGECRIERPGEPGTRAPGTVFDYLRKQLAARRVHAPGLPFDFSGGYVGWFGYELKADCGSPNRHRATTPDACWLFVDRFVAFDHLEGATYVLCLSEDTATGRREATDWVDATVTALSGMRPPSYFLPPSPTADPTAVEPWLVRDRPQYLAAIEACQRELRAGTSYEICLTNSAWLPAPGDSYDFYRALRRGNPAPFSAYLRFGEVDVACASPERFLRISPDGTTEAKPIKGTAPRAEVPEEDARLRDTLADSDKTRAENLMIVDLLRNDLGRVCSTGTVHVPRLMHTETYATVHQLVSTVRGRLRPGKDAVDCVRACFPGGSMTGAPKLRTLEIIDSLETEARGVYSGAIGFLSCNGAADLNIVIRTAVFTDDRMHIGAGGAIVLGSDPAEEYDEMLLKTAATMRAYHSVTSLVPAHAERERAR